MAVPVSELDERVRMLTRLREALVRRRDRVRRYLERLENEDGAMLPAERLEFRVEVERKVLHELSLFERAARPLEAIFREKDPAAAEHMPDLIAGLGQTREQIVERAALDGRLLELQDLRSEVKELKNDLALRRRALPIGGLPPRDRTLVDITA